MHEYATDASDRSRAPIIFAVISVVIAIWIHSRNLPVPWWVETPSYMAIYGIIYQVYERFLWRWFSGIPDLRGTWKGMIRSNYNGGTGIPASLHIQQNWKHICVRIKTGDSWSSSTMAALNTDSAREPGLKYEYLNEPNIRSVSTMQIHRGTARMRLLPDKVRLEGEYYTGRERMNTGSLEFKHVSRKIE